MNLDGGDEIERGESEEHPAGFYADDVPFRSGVVWNQAPLHMAFTAALNGFNPPRPEGRFRYCDLGCGNGMTLNAYAAMYPEAEFLGIDFNPGHISDARAQADELELDNVHYIQGSFDQVDLGDWPPFDFVGMNGIYSWLDEDVRPSAVRLVDRILRPGGLFYVEYMTMPGMVAVVPMWHLMQALNPDRGDGSRDRATRALRLLEELYNTGMSYLDRHPTAKNAAYGYVSTWRQNANQVDHFAHNALASGFQPRFFNEMATEMAEAGLVFGGRTQFMLNDPDLAVTLQQAGILRGIEDRNTRELLLDYMRNERNRRDVFVKDGEPDVDGARSFILNEIRFMDRRPSGAPFPELNLPGPRKMGLDNTIYRDLLRAFDGAARTLREADPEHEISEDTLITAGHRLAASGAMFICRAHVAGQPLAAAPEGLRVPDVVNAKRLAKAEEALTGCVILCRDVGGTLMQLGPLEVVLVNAWCAHGQSGALDDALDRLQQSDQTIRMNQRSVRAASLTANQLRAPFNGLVRIRVPNMVRMGALEPA
jgi:SAM-dependent methyltransferase